MSKNTYAKKFYHFKLDVNHIIITENHIIVLQTTSRNFVLLRKSLIYKNDYHPHFASPAIQLL
jgi:hypothetical protein